MTDSADSGVVGDGSITRAANIVTDAINGTVHVEDGTYFEDVVISRSVHVLGDNQPTIRPVADGNVASVVVDIRANDVTIEGLEVVVDRLNASGGIAASNVAQPDVNMLGGSFDNLLLKNNKVSSFGENGGSFDLVGGLNASAMGIALIGQGGPFHNVTLQGNEVTVHVGSAPISGGAGAVSVFTRGIYLGNVQAQVGGSGLGKETPALAWLKTFCHSSTTAELPRLKGTRSC